MSSVFATPVLTPLLRGLLLGSLRLCGWRFRLEGAPPPPFVLIGAPHTSNWDFVLMLATLFKLGHDGYWLGKDGLFSPPFKGLLQWLGGIPVDRSKSSNSVAAIGALLRQNPTRVLFMAPEGTRSKVTRWRTGFYFIALEAGLPIVMATLDTKTREIKLLGQYHPTGDAEHEIPEIQRHFRGFRGLRAENAFVIPE